MEQFMCLQMIVEPSFIHELVARAWQSALDSMSTSALALFCGIAYFVYKAYLAHRSEGWKGVKKHLLQDSLHGVVFGVCWWALLFSYHLFIKVPSKIRAEADAIKPPTMRLTLPPPSFWANKTVSPRQPKIDVNVSFKNSPLFTEKRKQQITLILNAYYVYLTKNVGFDLPRELPPIAVGHSNIITGGGGGPNTPIYLETLYVPDSDIDNPQIIDTVYSIYIFRHLFPFGNGDTETTYSNHASAIYECYFIASYSNRAVCKFPSPIKEWLNGLWAARVKFGRSYTDKMLLYTIKSWNLLPSNKKTFNDFFFEKLSSGQIALANDNKDYWALRDIIKQNGVELAE